MSERKVYFNGEFVSEQEARVSIFDCALMFGDMVFDMTRTYQQKPFRLREHLERTYAGLKYLEIDCGMTLEEMERATFQTLEINLSALDGADVQIMHNVSRGPLPVYKSVFGGTLRPTVTISCWPFWWHLAGNAPLYRSGVNSVVTAQRSVPAYLIDPKVKNRSRMFYQMANLLAQKANPPGWPLLTDDQGLITEGSGWNFFIVRKGRVLTPPGRNILLGITRGAVLELLTKLAIPWSEEDFGMYEMVNADEAFCTATSFAIMPCTRINGQPIGIGQPGNLTQKLIAAWSEMVGVDIVAQADEYARKVKEMELSIVVTGAAKR
ncbi:MAG: branched-chain amino acid aminotransferase [Acidobacteria bacterium]|nr:branched-chain amino acid aminotransferase [Acidobacteriota bacterium]